MSRRSPEELFISALIRSRDASAPVKLGVRGEHFDAFTDEWEWVERFIRKHGKTPTKMAYRTKFPDARLYVVDDLDHWADELHEAHARRTVVDMLTRSADLVMKGSLTDAVNVVNAGAKKLGLVMNAGSALRETSILADIDHIFDVVSAKNERLRTKGKAGVPSGFPTIDLATGGFQPGELWIVAARLGAGKSYVMMRMAAEAVRTANDALYSALEQSRAQVGLRVQALLSHATYQSAALNRGEVRDLDEYRKFLADLKKKINGALIVSDQPKITPDHLSGMIERNKPSIVFVDYLTLMRTSKSGASKDWLNVGELSSELKAIGEDYEIPVVSAAQINRAGADRKTIPGTEHLSYADAVGQDADGVITMVRMSQHILRARLAKYRNGEDGQKFSIHFAPGKGIVDEVSGDRANEIIEEDAAADDAD